jgi:hypothetical protein
MRLVPACLVDFLLTEVCLKHDRSSASGGTEILPGREVVRGATARRPPPWSSSPTSCQRQACCHGGPSGRVGHGLPARTGMTARPIDVRLVEDPVTPYVRTRLLSCRPCHLSAETNVALLQGGCAVSRYGRYKSRLRRHTRDTLDSQNSAFGDLPDVVDQLPRLCLLRREREFWNLQSRFTRMLPVQLIFLITHNVTQSWSRALETDHQGPRPAPDNQRDKARVSLAARKPKRPLQCSPGSLTKSVGNRLQLRTD